MNENNTIEDVTGSDGAETGRAPEVETHDADPAKLREHVTEANAARALRLLDAADLDLEFGRLPPEARRVFWRCLSTWGAADAPTCEAERAAKAWRSKAGERAAEGEAVASRILLDAADRLEGLVHVVAGDPQLGCSHLLAAGWVPLRWSEVGA